MRTTWALLAVAAGLTCVPPAQAADLKAGEYTCLGASGILIGLGFKVSGSRYTDLDGKESGTVSVNGSSVSFRGGHLDGYTGRDLNNNNFVIGSGISCGPSH